MIWRKPKQRRRKDLPDLKSLDFQQLPILQAHEIIQLLGLETRLKSIEKLTGAGTEYYQLLYTPALIRYLESVQLAPASAAHHHAGPGGLAVHTLDVIDIALRQRKSYNLPQHSIPESIAEQEHVWTYAVFAGALLHDIGKLICSTKLILETGAVWTPHDVSILKTGATYYQITFDKARYKLHTQLSNGFIHLLPPKGRGWLAQYPDIMAQLTAWLAGDVYEWGVVGEIVQQADRESVAKNLRLGGDRKRFPNAPTIPLVDKLTTALRQLLDEGQLKINRPEGSAGWCDGPYTYLVCGTVADAVRSHLYNAGATELPADNSRIYDTWQEHGFVISTPSDAAIWHLTINDTLMLTVLKFETDRIFHPSRRPDAFTGRLLVSHKKPAMKSCSDTGGPSTTPIQAPESGGPSTTPSRTKGDTLPSTPFIDKKTVNTDSNQREGHQVNNIYMADGGGEEAGKTQSAPISLASGNKITVAPSSLEDPEIAQYFLDWIKSGLNEKRIRLNRSDALVHIVKEGTLIVSPIAFKKFARDIGVVDMNSLDNALAETKAATKIQKKLERMMENKKMHRKTKNGMNIHTYLIQGENKTSKIRGWLLHTSIIFGESSHPAPNKALSNISGFYHEKKKNVSNYLGMT